MNQKLLLFCHLKKNTKECNILLLTTTHINEMKNVISLSDTMLGFYTTKKKGQAVKLLHTEILRLQIILKLTLI